LKSGGGAEGVARQVVADLSSLARRHLSDGGGFAEFAKSMTARFGTDAAPYLQAGWDQALQAMASPRRV
jgi:hypothetical protein